jgi:hypothetical protein
MLVIRFASNIVLILALASCVSSQKSFVAEAPKVSTGGQTEISKQDMATQPAYVYAADFVARNSDASVIMTGDDRVFWNSIDSVPGSSIWEAAAVIGAAKIAAGKAAATSQSGNAVRPASNLPVNPSFEKLCNERSVNVVAALKQNQFLLALAPVNVMLQGLAAGGNSESFAKEVVQALNMQKQNWSVLSLEAFVASAVAAAPTSGSGTNGPSGLSPADIRSADEILMDAEILANQKSYQAAIKRVAMIGSESPFYVEAQDKMKSYGKGAVQELRQKAARAYQSSLPISDRIAKLNFLKQAKQHLEEAITSYPDVEDVATVRENLAMIERELAQVGGN